jgi:hypothetical protein
MLAAMVETKRSTFAGPEGPMVWLENEQGPIARGAVALLSAEGAHVRLIGDASIEPGDEVDVRLSLDRESPILAASGRILWTQERDGAIECELEWTHSGPQREHLEALIAARA